MIRTIETKESDTKYTFLVIGIGDQLKTQLKLLLCKCNVLFFIPSFLGIYIYIISIIFWLKNETTKIRGFTLRYLRWRPESNPNPLVKNS